MKKFTLEIPLKQHTPIIHFQASKQKRATLRASDVKPRIDKYLGGTKKYKLTITANIANDYPKAKGNEPYFGDHQLCLYENIMLDFNTYFDTVLKEEIKRVLPTVFALENFGSFGDKGYGCFTYNTNQNEFQKILLSNGKDVYYWDSIDNSIKEIFFEIKYFYALLKSGINVIGRTSSDPTTYYKSLLMLYFKDKKYDASKSIRWEKRAIKKEFKLNGAGNRTKNIDQTDKTIPNGEIYNAVKPLFGYSELQEWQSYGLKKDKRNPAMSNPIKIQLPDEIDRIPSPIYFKVFRNNNNARIYFMLRNEEKFYDKVYPNKPFIYSIKGQCTQPIYSPSSFDYSVFLTDAIYEINNNLIPNGTGGGYTIAENVDRFITHLTTKKIGKL